MNCHAPSHLNDEINHSEGAAKMLTIDEEIAIIENDINQINERRHKLEDEIYYLNKRKTFDKEALRKLREKKEQEHDT